MTGRAQTPEFDAPDFDAPEFDAIVLAGGRARRLAGSDKPAELVGGRRLLDIALAAVDGAVQRVVVGPARPLPARVLLTREEPPFAGPAAALTAGFSALPKPAPIVVVVASDLPDLSSTMIATLLTELTATGAPAVFAVDESGQPQYLLGAWTRSALANVGAATGSSMRALVPAGARFVPVDDTGDVDTPEQLDAARRRTRHALNPSDARAMARASLPPLPVTTRAASSTAGAVLATPLVALAQFPPFDASAMDGYAVAGNGPWRLIEEPHAAGHRATHTLTPGEAVPIATGAALPPGAERVIRFEETDVSGDQLTTTNGERDDTRRAGSAWPRGAVLASDGLDADLAVRSVARAAGVATLDVRGPLRVHLHTSGDEILAADADPRPGALPDTASDPVGTLLRTSGTEVIHAGHLADTLDAFRGALTAPDIDVVVVIGATGHGVADHLRAALKAEGAQVILDGIAMRPGGSLLVARLPRGTVLLGLGGNPLAAVAGTAVMFPAIRDALLARRPHQPELLELVDDAVRIPERWRVLPVEPTGSGRWTVTAGTGTGHLASAIGYRGLALVPPRGAAAPVERLR